MEVHGLSHSKSDPVDLNWAQESALLTSIVGDSDANGPWATLE